MGRERARNRKLTANQKRILLDLCNEALNVWDRGILLIKREASIGVALVRKGFAKRMPDGRFIATPKGFFQGDTLRTEARRFEFSTRPPGAGRFSA